MNGDKYIQSVLSDFRRMKETCDSALSQVKDEDYFWQPAEESNSIAVIMRHLSGNMLSRWTDFLTSDGEKPWRNRDEEFERIFYTDKDDILSRWETGWGALFETLSSLKDEDLMKTVLIKEESISAVEAINRQLYHTSYHIGQIVYLAKYRVRAEWKALTIPRNK